MEFTEPIKKELAEVEKTLLGFIPQNIPEVYEPISEIIKRGGKRARPMLTLLTCRALDGETGRAIKPASLIELFHTFTLVHDDIEDDSQMRRGKPTLNVKYGIPIALNCGDAMYTLVWNKLSEIEETPETILELQHMFSSAFLRVVEGQGLELSWYHSKKFNVTEQEYYSMVGGKTGALMALSCETGAYLADADAKTRARLNDFGEKIGVAFQIQDDVLNVSGEFSKYQKEIGGDITEGKRTLIVSKTFEKCNKEEHAELTRILEAHTTSQKDIGYAIALFKKYGAMDYARKKAIELIEESKILLEHLPDNESKKSLMKMADFFVSREA
jgi:geranylgeranyl pyrophosphate synthase